jgi:hypothetical protein
LKAKTNSPEHGPQVVARLARLNKEQRVMLKLGKQLFGKEGSAIFPLDLLAYAALKRNIAISEAMSLVIAMWNMTTARTLLRVHIDTGLRFSAAWLVDDPQGFASKVVAGERIDKLKDKKGKLLRDAHLVEVRSMEYPWLPEVYKRLSGYVHFSGSHFHDTIESIDEDSISFDIRATDHKYPESSWVEVLDCFSEASSILAWYLRGYIETKALSPEELATLRNKKDA